MEKKRFEHIDFLRAVAIMSIIAIHTLSYNLNNTTNYFLWNYLHFDVVAFVFCSGYVLTAGYREKLSGFSNILRWYKKRLLRLLIPFYIYLFFHYSLWFLLPDFFGGLELKKSVSFLLQSVFLIGGVNLNWLPLLFVQLTLLFPLFIKGLAKKKFLYFYTGFSVAVTIFFTMIIFPYTYYRYVMFIPWSLVMLSAIFVFLKEQKETVSVSMKRYIQIGLLSAFVFFILFLLWHPLQRSFSLIDHKYPPNLYFLSYATCITCVILLISRLSVLKLNAVKTIYTFISSNAYQLFFIHYIALDFVLTLTKRGMFWSNVGMQFLLVVSLSLFTSFAIKQVKSLRIY